MVVNIDKYSIISIDPQTLVTKIKLDDSFVNSETYQDFRNVRSFFLDIHNLKRIKKDIHLQFVFRNPIEGEFGRVIKEGLGVEYDRIIYRWPEKNEERFDVYRDHELPGRYPTHLTESYSFKSPGDATLEIESNIETRSLDLKYILRALYPSDVSIAEKLNTPAVKLIEDKLRVAPFSRTPEVVDSAKKIYEIIKDKEIDKIDINEISENKYIIDLLKALGRDL